MSTIIIWLVMLVIAYLIGSLSSAIIICRILGLPDPRTQGSNNPGATNVMRLGGKKVGLTVLMLDVLKGVIPVLIARWLNVSGFGLATVGLAATVGHMYPIFFKFKGGKGVATAAGVIFALSWLLGLAVISVFVITTLIWRYVGLSSIIAASSAPIFSLFIGSISYTLPIALMAVLIIYRHLDNIQRLREGTENKLNF